MSVKRFLNNQTVHFYMLFFTTIVLIFFTHPFLKYPFDMFVHLHRIDLQYNAETLPAGRLLWHYFWAKIFLLFSIDNTQLFLRAHIIHYVQTIISFLSVFFVSKVLIRNLFLKVEPIYLNYLAYWSTLIWFSIFATMSVGIHQVWIMWYSINYQISLPLMLLITGMTISLIFDTLSLKRKIFYILAILFLTRVILQIHSMEFLYFLMYVCVLFVVFLDKIFYLFKKRFYIAIPTIIAIVIFIPNLFAYLKSFEGKNSRILAYLSNDKLPLLYHQIMTDGAVLLQGSNRAHASMNELIYLSIFSLFLMAGLTIFHKIQHKSPIFNIRLLLFVFITSLFVFIPVYQFSAGLAGLLVSSTAVVNRFYYSSLLFIVIPSTIYFFLLLQSDKTLFKLNLFIALTLLGTFYYSRYDTGHHQNYYKNIQSIKNAFHEQKVGFNLSQQQIVEIGELSKHYEKESNATTPYYFAREDIAFILRQIYEKKVFLPVHWNGRKLLPDFYIRKYKQVKTKDSILFKTPKGFPNYEPYQ